jgi:hypothetical protein
VRTDRWHDYSITILTVGPACDGGSCADLGVPEAWLAVNCCMALESTRVTSSWGAHGEDIAIAAGCCLLQAETMSNEG